MRKQIANDTVKILRTGKYMTDSGDEIDISMNLANAKSNSILYKPTELMTINRRETAVRPTSIEITAETTLHAAQRLVVHAGLKDTICLNFASAKNPGGGFLNGSQAQEESLARSSGLYACISPVAEMYEHNTRNRSALYSDCLSEGGLKPFA